MWWYALVIPATQRQEDLETIPGKVRRPYLNNKIQNKGLRV
jgi:hypothetical protein